MIMILSFTEQWMRIYFTTCMQILFSSHLETKARWVIIGFGDKMNGANINKIHDVIFL